jgi:hypothetical protein
MKKKINFEAGKEYVIRDFGSGEEITAKYYGISWSLNLKGGLLKYLGPSLKSRTTHDFISTQISLTGEYSTITEISIPEKNIQVDKRGVIVPRREFFSEIFYDSAAPKSIRDYQFMQSGRIRMFLEGNLIMAVFQKSEPVEARVI